MIVSESSAAERMIVDGHQNIYDLSESSGWPQAARMISLAEHLLLTEL
jgi:hypothetical protein